MMDKVKEVQEYLWKRGIEVTETSIVHVAIVIATRWGGNEVFTCHFQEKKKR